MKQCILLSILFCLMVPAIAQNGTSCPCDYPSINFKDNSLAISNDAKTILNAAAKKLKAAPDCSIQFTGYPDTRKSAQALCNKRLESLKRYFIEICGISADRIQVNCIFDLKEDRNIVAIKCDE